MSTVWLRGDRELNLFAAHPRAADVADRDANVLQPEPPREGLQPALGEPEREQAPEGHVAADARGGIEDRESHGRKLRNLGPPRDGEPRGRAG